MATKLKIKQGRNIETAQRKLSVLGKGMNSRTAKAAEKIADQIVKIMKDKAPVATGSLRSHIFYESSKIQKNNHIVNIRSTSPYSNYNEFGVEPHWVNVEKHPKLKAWMIEKFGSYSSFVRLGGGKNSRIKKNKSKNKFFYNSIEEYLSTTKSEAEYVKALKEAFKEFKTR